MLKLLVVFTVCCFASRKRSDTDFLLNQLMIVFLDPVSSVVGSDDGAMYCNYDKAGNRARELWAWMDATEIAPCPPQSLLHRNRIAVKLKAAFFFSVENQRYHWR